MRRIAPAAALVALVAGCGGGGQDRPAGPPLPKAQYVAQVSRICGSAAGAARLVRLRALPPPGADKPLADAWLDQLERAGATADELAQEIEVADWQEVRVLRVKLAVHQGKAAGYAARLGAAACAGE